MKKKPFTTTTSPAPTQLHSLDALLLEIQRRRLLLVLEADTLIVWSPCVKVAKWIQRAVFKYQQTLIRMITDADKRLCVTPLHERHHKRGVCLACQRLNVSFASESRGIAS